jgi:hypothetical protein
MKKYVKNINSRNFEPSLGDNIHETIKKAIELATKRERNIKFEFNGVTVIVNALSDSELIYRDWNRAFKGYIDSEVGPEPTPKLTKEELENDARIAAKQQKIYGEAHKERQRKDDIKRKMLENKLMNAPEVKLINEEDWLKSKKVNSDPYGAAAFTFAERWARLMQLEIAKGNELKDIAEKTEREADLEGITGFMYGCAVSLLKHCWVHGEELKKWRESEKIYK